MSVISAPPATTRQTARSTWDGLVSACVDRAWIRWGILLVWCGGLFFYGLTAGELWRTESLRAIVGAEFLRSGNWIVPTLYGEPLFTKPPGMYAAIALVSWPFGGVTEWTARLPSALAATITVFLFYGFVARHLGRRTGLLAALILPVGLMWLDKATTAEIDMLQVAWVTASLLCFFRALEVEEAIGQAEREARSAERGALGLALRAPRSALRGSAWRWWLAALLCVAGGVLTKWTAPAFFYSTVVTLLWWRGELRLLFGRRHLVSAALAATLCLTWIAAAIAQTGFEVFASTVQREALHRIVPNYAERPYSWGEVFRHPLVLLVATLPCSAVALFALRPGFAQLWDERGRRLLQALHCWIWPNMLIWSLMSEHAPRHSFPLFPGIAGLAAMVWHVWLTGRLSWHVPRLVSPRQVLVGALVLWLAVKLVFVHAVVPSRNAHREPRAKAQLLASLVPSGATLYLFQLKDEGIMFYYARAVIRLESPVNLPSSDQPLYCILQDSELEGWESPRSREVVCRFTDEQGAPIVLVRVLN